MAPSFNILYFIQRFFELAGGVSYEAWEPRLFLWLQYIEWTALGISVVLLVYYVWLRVLIHHVEEEMEHHRHEAELTAAGAHHEEKKNERWEKVVELANSTHESDWRRAILEADNMLKALLDDRGFPGEDIGEQLRGTNRAHFATLDLAWEAHRMRNKIAHEGEALTLVHRDTLATIDLYRRVFEEFKYL